MKKILVLFAFLFCLSFFTSQNSYSQHDSEGQALTFYIENNTPFTLTSIYISFAGENWYTYNILPRLLYNEETVKVYFPEDNIHVDIDINGNYVYLDSCLFDIKVTDNDGNAVMFDNVDACALHKEQQTLQIYWVGDFPGNLYYEIK